MKKFLAGLDPAQFLRRHWQKRPLLARAALREYIDCVTRADVFALAAREDIESRIVIKARRRWHVRHGPFSRTDIERLPRSGWTLLVQGVDHALPQAARLLREFSFIPYARFDDVMVSYAAPGGGVGPHFDSYDVFLVQGSGDRRWRIGEPRNLELVSDAPLKILRHFEPDDEWRLEAGDLLYVPPRWPHEGVAVGECITYSIGFRAPSAQELASRFLDHLQDEVALDGVYEDPDLRPTRHPGRLEESTHRRMATMLEPVRWNAAQVSRFIGCYLTEPKPHVEFARPRRPLARRSFEERVRARGLRTALATRMLYRGRHFYINGEAHEVAARAAPPLRTLADARALTPPLRISSEAWGLLYDWYLAGYIHAGV